MGANQRTTEAGSSRATSGEALLSALLETLKEDQGGAKKTALRRALDLEERAGSPARTSTDVRVERLESTVAALDAYTDALEEFLDDEGRAETVLADVQGALERLEGELLAHRREIHERRRADERLADRIETLETRLEGRAEATDERTAAIEASVEALDDDVDGVAYRLETLEGDVDDRFERIHGRLETLETDLDALDGEFGDRFDEVVGRLDELEEVADRVEGFEERFRAEVSSIGSQIGEVEAELTDSQETLGAKLTADVEALREDVDAETAALESTLSATESELGASIAELEAFVERLEERTAEAEKWRESLEDALAPIDDG